MSLSSMGGETPLYKIVSNASDEVTQIVEWVNQCTESDILLKDICIASPSMGLMKDLQSHLHVNGIEYKVLKGTSKVGSNNGISLCTFHSLKGLEFKVIIRFRKINEDGTDAIIKVKMLKNVRKAPASTINWSSRMIEKALEYKNIYTIHHYHAVVITELGERETLNLTAVSIDDAKELVMDLVLKGLLELNGRSCMTIELTKVIG